LQLPQYEYANGKKTKKIKRLNNKFSCDEKNKMFYIQVTVTLNSLQEPKQLFATFIPLTSYYGQSPKLNSNNKDAAKQKCFE